MCKLLALGFVSPNPRGVLYSYKLDRLRGRSLKPWQNGTRVRELGLPVLLVRYYWKGLAFASVTRRCPYGMNIGIDIGIDISIGCYCYGKSCAHLYGNCLGWSEWWGSWVGHSTTFFILKEVPVKTCGYYTSAPPTLLPKPLRPLNLRL